RTAAITAACIAVADAVAKEFGDRKSLILRDSVAAVSAGIVEGELLLDLNYHEDSRAEVDLNVVRLGQGGFVEVQGTGEGGVFSRAQLQALLELAETGIDQLKAIQHRAIGLPLD
ncbi:MAG TPA: ribonuclease PH, partial [Isosphaeraceae bacterium]|nr:ribonuclease PH [Isosphaeraceae bacterium]